MELYLERQLTINTHNEWIRVPTTEIKLNRSVNADIRLYSTYVSRQHAVLQTQNNELCIKDQGSSYGVFINNFRIENNKFYPLTTGDVVEIAKPPLHDPVLNKMTINDRFIYTTCSGLNIDLDKRKAGPKRHNSALFIPQVKCEKSANILAQSLGKTVSVTVKDIAPCDIKTVLNSNTAPCKSNKTLRVTLDKSRAIDNIVFEQENKRLKMELQQKQTEINEKDDKIECLKLKSCESVEKLEKLVDAMESELQCTICSEIFMKAVTLNCTHTFCEFCILQWRKVKQECPMCRIKILTVTRTLFVDNYIERVILGLSKKFQDERKELVEERQKAFDEYNAMLNRKQAAKAQNAGRGRGRRRRGRRNNNVVNTGIPVIRMQNISLTVPPPQLGNEEPILIDSQSSTQFEPSTSMSNADSIIVIS